MSYRRIAPRIVVIVAAIAIATLVLTAALSLADEGSTSPTSPPLEQPALLAPAAPVPGGPNFFSQTAIGFQPWPSGSVPYSISGRTLYNPDSSSHAYEAMINVPHGAVITKFVVWAYDNNGSYNMWAAIGKAALDDSSVVQIARIDSSGASGSVRAFQDTSITQPRVDLQSYTYWIDAYLPPNSSVGLVSFRIDYGYGAYLPLLQR